MFSRLWREFRPYAGLALSVLLLASVFGAFSWVLSDSDVKLFVKDYGLGCLLLAVSLFLFSGYRCSSVLTRGRALAFLKRRWLLVLIWGACCVYAISLYPPGYRTLMDEVVVLSTSKAIHEDRQPVTPTGMEHAMGVKRLSMAYIDKRPYLYAWLVSLAHDFHGYSPGNLFLVNRILGCVALALIGVSGWIFSGRRQAGAALAMLSLSAVTLFPQHVTGGGIDVLNIACLLGVLLCSYFYVNKPTPDSLRLLIGAAVLAAYARYESIIFLAVPILLMAWRWRAARKVDLDGAGGLYVASVFPLGALHYLTFSRSEQSFQLVEKKLEKAFSFDYINENLGYAWSFFTDQDHMLTNSTLVFALGLVAFLVLVGMLCVRGNGKSSAGLPGVFWLFTGFICAIFGLLMCYAWGDIRQPIASRLSLPVYLLFSLCIAIVATKVRFTLRVAIVISLMLGLSMYWSSYRLANKDYHSKIYGAQQRIARFDQFVQRQPNADFAVVSDLGIFWLTRDVVSVYPNALQSNPQYLCNMVKSGMYSRIFLIEELDKGPDGVFVPTKGSLLPESLIMKSRIVWEVPGSDDIRLRFSLIEDADVKVAAIDINTASP